MYLPKYYFEHSPSIIPLLEENEDTNCIDDLEASDSSSKVDVFEDCKDDDSFVDESVVSIFWRFVWVCVTNSLCLEAPVLHLKRFS